MTVTFRHGNPLLVDYTPSGADVAAGAVVVIGDDTRIAHFAIKDGQLGSLAAGGGVYEVPKSTSEDMSAGAGKRVYWDATNSRITLTASTHKIFGRLVDNAATAAATAQAIHEPGVDLIA